MEPILQIENLKVLFDTSIQRILAIDDVSIDINIGEVVGIIGASGSGKSTIARSILGLFSKNQTTEGRILLNTPVGQVDLLLDVDNNLTKIRGKTATMVFQNPLFNLNPSVTIQKHFDRILKLRKVHNQESLIIETLEKVGLAQQSKSVLSAYPHQLSGGQQQRILIAIALCQKVKLLLLDEPMSALDNANQEAIKSIILSLVKNDELSVLLISHDLNIMEHLANRIYVLHQGRIVESGSVEEIIHQPQDNYTKELVAARELAERNEPSASEDSIISFRNLSHTYKKGGFFAITRASQRALTEINVDISAGQITGLIGASGSGKTTLVKLLLGFENIQEGDILFQDIPLHQIPKKKRSSQIQMIPQNTVDAFNPRMLIKDQLEEVFNAHTIKRGAGFLKIIESLLIEVDLKDDLLLRYPAELSGGEVQRMAILRALLVQPKVLILDESLSALDMVVQKKTLDLIISINQKLKMTIILIAHDARLIRHCCHSVIELKAGKILPV